MKGLRSIHNQASLMNNSIRMVYGGLEDKIQIKILMHDEIVSEERMTDGK